MELYGYWMYVTGIIGGFILGWIFHPKRHNQNKTTKQMTDRYNSLVVALDRDIREDDAEVIISAIKMIKGVADVTGNIVDPDSYVAERRVLNLIQDKLYALIKELNNG